MCNCVKFIMLNILKLGILGIIMSDKEERFGCNVINREGVDGEGR